MIAHPKVGMTIWFWRWFRPGQRVLTEGKITHASPGWMTCVQIVGEWGKAELTRKEMFVSPRAAKAGWRA